MNKWLWSLLCVTLLGAAACSDDDTEGDSGNPIPPALSTENLPDAGLKFLYSALTPHTFTMSVDAPWEITKTAGWFVVTPNKGEAGQNIQVTVTPTLNQGEARDGDQAVQLAERLRPDVVLMDIRMPRVNGIDATRAIRSNAALQDVQVLILTTFDLDEYVYDALSAGAGGFLLKDAEPDEIASAVRVVAAGEALIEPSITRRLIETFVAARPGVPAGAAACGIDQLTDREREILTLVARGLNNDQIGERLFISPATVKTHLARIMAKLDAHDRAQLVVRAYESGLVKPGVM